MVNIRLYGALKQFGTLFELDVRDTAEALRALCAQLPNFRQALMKGYFKVRIGKDYLDNRYLEKGMFYQLKQGATIHITPVLTGAKSAGVFQMIAGAVIVGLMWWNPLGWSSAAVMMGMGMGASLMLGGVAQMLTKTPKMGDMGKGAEKKQSTAFSSLQNMAAQGRPVPLAYGRIRVGSMIISQGVETFDTEITPESQKPKKAGFGKGRM